jgi:magnesium-transporting ATPase (P-type)
LTAAAIARRVGIGSEGTQVVEGSAVDRMSDGELDSLLRGAMS